MIWNIATKLIVFVVV